VKVAVVGGGSTYTPELVDGFARMADELPVDELVLHDVDASRLEIVGGASERILRAGDWPGRFVLTDDLVRAVDGADAVLLQIRVGGQAARHTDETIPLRCGCVGQETTGAGGFMKALRTIPVIAEVADTVRAHAADDAWIVDFTNPVGIVTRSLLDDGHRAVGLCNVAIGFQRRFARWLDVKPTEVRLGHAGLNHLTWIRSVQVGGEDVLAALLESHADDLADEIGLPVELLYRLGAVPSYYLRYFYRHDEVVAELLGSRSRAEEVADLERELLTLYQDPAVHHKPEQLGQRGGAYYSEAALQLVSSLVNDRGDVQVVDLRNAGAIAGLPDDAVVEVPARIGRGGPTAEPLEPLPPDQAGLVAHVGGYEELTVAAARSGDRELAYRALLAHPLIGQSDLVDQLLDELLEANLHLLPEYWSPGSGR
jgi:6-phospho-beta-glucosidase